MPETLKAWLEQPFSPNMSAARWFAFIGLLLVLLWSWGRIVRELGEIQGELT